MNRAMPFFLLLCALLCSPNIAYAGPVITDVTTDRARYSPQETVHLSITLANHTGRAITGGTVRLACTHLDTPVPGPAPQTFRLAPQATRTLLFSWKPPRHDFQGYAVEARARDTAGRLLDSGETAVDVSSTWTKFPRYGFLSRFPPQPAAVSQAAVRRLNDYHLNALQFQDWQYKHDQPLAGTVAHPAATWRDIANRLTARRTVLDLIASAHRAGMAAMNYNLLYGAWAGYGNNGADYRWGLWKNPNGTDQDSFPLPAGWATPTVSLFNPADPGWQDFLIGQEANVFAAYSFDGWQVDQLGDRGTVYDVSGHPVTLWQTFRPFLNVAKAHLRKTIIFNNVGAYGLYDTAAHSTEDAVYVECWEWAGQRTYNDLKTIIGQASQWSGGKGVILAAYMDRAYADHFSVGHPGRFNPPGVLLTDAAIFANGGDHLELGDDGQMLDNEYFPNRNLTPGPALMNTLRHYYDFRVAYENLLYSGLKDTPNTIALKGVPTSTDAAPHTVWAFAKAGDGYHILHLINLIGESSNAWRDDNATAPIPTPQTNFVVKYYDGGSAPISRVSLASPDRQDGTSTPLSFTTGADAQGHYIRFIVPTLAYWDMVYFR